MTSGNNRQAADEHHQARRNHATVATSRQWSATQSQTTESRIVRVSRVFGGKDRHSKVNTVKGLRDRRVRLSVPTAIQIYDLQDRLGLNQPSKVVDWLLNATRHEIDKLPPLQFPPRDLMVQHLPSPMMPLVHEEKFSNMAATTSERAGDADGSGAHSYLGSYQQRFMRQNNSSGMVNSAMAYNNYNGEAWNNNNNVHDGSEAGSPDVAGGGSATGGQYSSCPSLLSFSPGPHQLVFYSSEAGQQFQVDNLRSQSVSSLMSSAREGFP